MYNNGSHLCSSSFVSCLRQTRWLFSFRNSLVLSCCRNGITDVHYHACHTTSSFMCVTEIQTVALMLARQLIYQFLEVQELNNSHNQEHVWIKLAALLLDSATLMSIIYPDAILLRVIRCSPSTDPPVGIHMVMLKAPSYPEPYDGQALRYQSRAETAFQHCPAPLSPDSSHHSHHFYDSRHCVSPGSLFPLCFAPLHIGMVLLIPVLLRIPLHSTV